MGRQERRHSVQKQRNYKPWIYGSIAVLILAGLLVLANTRGTGVDYAPYTYTDDQLAKPDAPHVVEEFSDFQCPFCQQLAPTMHAVRDLENVRFEYKHFPLRQIHPDAQLAAEASECAREQNKFWAYHDVLMDSKKLDKRSLKLHAAGLGLDTGAFNECLDSGRSKAAVQEDYLEGSQRGVQGTPAVFLDGELFNGRDVQSFVAATQD